MNRQHKEYRQTGRTTRIINFVIDQLYSAGEVIVTDHVSFEYRGKIHKTDIQIFVDRIIKSLHATSPAFDWSKELLYEIKELDGIKLVHFKMNNEIPGSKEINSLGY